MDYKYMDEQIENFKNHGKVFIALSLDGVSIKSNYPRFGKNEEKLVTYYRKFEYTDKRENTYYDPLYNKSI